jgi:HEAT repeat protein
VPLYKRGQVSMTRRSALSSVAIVVPLAMWTGGCSREPSSEGKPLSHWVQTLESGGSPEWFVAASAIAEIGPPASDALPALRKALQDRVFRCRAAEVYVVVAGAQGNLAPVIKLLRDDSSWSTRACMAGALGHGGRGAVSALIDALRDPSATVRSNATDSLGFIGKAAVDAVPALIEAAKDSDPQVAAGAREALRRIQGTPEPK